MNHNVNPISPAKPAKYQRRRSEIIDAAAAVFAERGYHGASTKAIADRLGIRQGSLYYYFASKEEALEEVCYAGVGEFVQRLEKIAGDRLSATEKIRAAVRNHLEPMRDRPDYVRVFLNDRGELPPHSRRRVGRLTRRYEALIEAILREGHAAGEFRADLDSGLAALALIGLCNSVQTWIGRRVPAISLDHIASSYAELFLAGILGPDPRR